MMTLRQKQSIFALLVARLILKADAMGYETTLGEAWRSPEEAARLAKLGKGIVKSLHTSRLAIDLNLFRNGHYLSSTESYRPLGAWWETIGAAQGVTTAWGGRFTRHDGGHFSLEHEGRQ